MASCDRILWFAAVVSVALYLVVEFAIRPKLPALQFNWFLGFAAGVGGITAQITAYLVLMLVIPPRISINRKGISIQGGQSVRFFKHDQIESVHFVFRHNGRHFIRIHTLTYQRRVGLTKHIAMTYFDQFLNNKIVVHDRRQATNRSGGANRDLMKSN